MLLSSLIVIYVLMTVIFIGYQAYRYKDYLSSMVGMMIAMAIAMIASLTIGISLDVKIFGGNATLVTIYATVIGMIIGYIVGCPFGILAQLDGVLAGIMGGLMGPMTGLMISNSNPYLFIGFFNLVFALVMILIYQLIQRSIPDQQQKQARHSWLILLVLICFFLTIHAIYESSSKSLLQANLDQQGMLNKGYQEAVIQVLSNGYSPSNISLKLGVPARLHFQKNVDGGCLSYLLINDLDINRELHRGDNIIQFTPEKKGILTYTCGMGMYQGKITIE
jgi:hypothetical protein